MPPLSLISKFVAITLQSLNEVGPIGALRCSTCPPCNSLMRVQGHFLSCGCWVYSMTKREAVKYRLAAFSKQESRVWPPESICAQALMGLTRVFLTIALRFRSWVAARCEWSVVRFPVSVSFLSNQ